MMKKNIQRNQLTLIAALVIATTLSVPPVNGANNDLYISNLGENIEVKRIETLLNNPGNADARWQSKVQAQLDDLATFGNPNTVRDLTNRYNAIRSEERVTATPAHTKSV